MTRALKIVGELIGGLIVTLGGSMLVDQAARNVNDILEERRESLENEEEEV